MSRKVDGFPMTTKEASGYLGLAEDTVRKYINRGLIAARKAGPIHLVTKAECDRFKKTVRRRGNPNFVKQR